MKSVKGSNHKAQILRIEGEITIYQVNELKLRLLDALNQSETVEVDLSAVSELDTAGVQLLLMAKKSAQARSKELRLMAHSHAVLEVFDLLDLSPYFGDPVVIPFRADKVSSEVSQ